jgi:hypothetical protein
LRSNVAPLTVIKLAKLVTVSIKVIEEATINPVLILNALNELKYPAEPSPATVE